MIPHTPSSLRLNGEKFNFRGANPSFGSDTNRLGTVYSQVTDTESLNFKSGAVALSSIQPVAGGVKVLAADGVSDGTFRAGQTYITNHIAIPSGRCIYFGGESSGVSLRQYDNKLEVLSYPLNAQSGVYTPTLVNPTAVSVTTDGTTLGTLRASQIHGDTSLNLGFKHTSGSTYNLLTLGVNDFTFRQLAGAGTVRIRPGYDNVRSKILSNRPLQYASSNHTFFAENGTTLGTIETGTLNANLIDNPSAALTLGNSTHGVSVPGNISASQFVGPDFGSGTMRWNMNTSQQISGQISSGFDKFRFYPNNGFGVNGFMLSIAGINFAASPASTTPGATIGYDANNILAQRNGINAQQSRLYKTYTDSTSGEWLSLDAQSSATAYRIGSAIGSAGGSNRDIEFGMYNSAGVFTAGLIINNGNLIALPNGFRDSSSSNGQVSAWATIGVRGTQIVSRENVTIVLDWNNQSTSRAFQIFTDAYYPTANPLFKVDEAGNCEVKNNFTASGTSTIIPPTTDPEVAGALWNDGGVLKISAGVPAP